MEKYELLKELLPYIERYEAEYHNQKVLSSAADFATWLKREISVDLKVPDPRTGDEAAEVPRGEDVQTTISKMIYMMYRYARFYTKKATVNSTLNGLDDFGLLATLLTHKSIAKSELINMFMLDKTTGMEIINRLVRLGLVVQETNAEDKRSKKIAISDAGRQELFKVFGEMQKTANIVTGNLDAGEKVELLHLLCKLHDFHHELVNQPGHLSIDNYAEAAQKLRSKQ